jgi:hypothetical protein
MTIAVLTIVGGDTMPSHSSSVPIDFRGSVTPSVLNGVFLTHSILGFDFFLKPFESAFFGVAFGINTTYRDFLTTRGEDPTAIRLSSHSLMSACVFLSCPVLPFSHFHSRKHSLLASCEPILMRSSILQCSHRKFSGWLRIKHVSKSASEPQYNRLTLVPPVLVLDGGPAKDFRLGVERWLYFSVTSVVFPAQIF